MAHILSLTGSSGVGKTTIARALISALPNAQMVTSYTTRKARETDITGEYVYVSEESFSASERAGEFLWTATHAGMHYGTKAEQIKNICDADALGIMILVPEVISKLRAYLTSLGKLSTHVPVFVISPEREVLLARLATRSDAVRDTERRLAEASPWEERIRAEGVPFHFIPNGGAVEEAVQEVTSLLA